MLKTFIFLLPPAGTEFEVDGLEHWASDDAKALMMWIKSVLAKYWILLCCGAFLLVSLQNDVSVYQIGYMAIFLFILLCYQVIVHCGSYQLLMYCGSYRVIVYCGREVASVFAYCISVLFTTKLRNTLYWST